MMFFVYGMILVVVCYALVTIVWYTVRNGISPMPTGPRVQEAFLNVLQNIDPDGVLVEPGSGWGTLTLAIARRFPDCRIVGVENSPVPFVVSRLLCCVMSVSNVTFERRDFYSVSLMDCDVVICYLYPGAMARLCEKFARELKPGTRVLSHTFAVPGWEPERVVEAEDLYRTKIYVYCVPPTPLIGKSE